MPDKKKVNKYAFEKLEEREDRNYLYQVIRVKSTNKKKGFEIDDIEHFYDDMKKEDPKLKSTDVAIEVMGIVKTFTLKYFKNDYFYDLEDYLRGKVYDVDKFDNFEYFDVIVKKVK